MNNENKSGNFLKALQKYSEDERRQMELEMQEKTARELKAAEKQAELDADFYIKKQLSGIRSQVTGEYAVKNLNAQGELFRKRAKMVETVFENAEKKLADFTKTPEYKSKLLSYAKEIHDAFQGNACVLSIRNDDLKYEEDIRKIFSESAAQIEIKPDITIRLGGIRGYCEELRQIADNTLDSKLEAQKQWFVENADLKIN